MKSTLNLFATCFLLSGAAAAATSPGEVTKETTILIVAAVLPSVTWLLLVHPAIRRRAAGVRLFFGLVIIAGVVVYLQSDRSRYMAVMTGVVVLGAAVSFLVAQHAVRCNRIELDERRHSELVEAAAAKAVSMPPPRQRGTVRSRARRNL